MILRCANCYECPSCGNTLSTRATAVAIASGNPEEKATAKKVFYLACGFCRWSTRDVGIADRSNGKESAFITAIWDLPENHFWARLSPGKRLLNKLIRSVVFGLVLGSCIDCIFASMFTYENIHVCFYLSLCAVSPSLKYSANLF